MNERVSKEPPFAANQKDMVDPGDSDIRVCDVVLTTYGVGVITSINDEKVSTRLWRIPGKSVRSSAKATLHKSSVCCESILQLTRLVDPRLTRL